MKRYNTQDPSQKPPIVMLVYGEGGVGKTTFASSAPKPLLADCEGGSKYFGLRGIKLDVAMIEKWADMKEYLEILKKEGYETAVIDPIGELMGKLKRHMIAMGDRKLVQNDGSPSMAGWGWLKSTMRDYLKVIRDTGLHVLLVAHVEEKDDDGRIVKRPLLETKLWTEVVNMVDIVGYMTIVQDSENQPRRVVLVDPSSDKFIAKDRTGQLGKVVEPDFSKIVAACQGSGDFAWMAKEAVKPSGEKVAEEKPANESEHAKKMREAKDNAKAKLDAQESSREKAPASV